MRQMGKRIGICLLLAAVCWTVGIVRDRAFLNRELIRFHVVANSDSDEDQAVKLRVRDAVLDSIRSDLKMVGDINRQSLSEREPAENPGSCQPDAGGGRGGCPGGGDSSEGGL